MNNAIDIMSQTIQKQFFEDSQDNAWFGSKFDIVNYLKIDSSGKLGLSFITTICNMSNVDNEPKKYQEDGYTLIINNKKVVIKTARMDKNKKFQHESLSNDDKYDYILFVDISPQNLYLTILKKFDLSVKNEIVNKKPHLRKFTTNVYKFDFSKKQINKCISNGHCLEITEDTHFERISNFIKEKIL